MPSVVNILLVSWRGFSGNKGKPTENGLYEDARSAINWIKEQGVDWSSIGWRGFATQQNVPTDIVESLTRHLTEIATSEQYSRFMEEQGFAIDVKVGADFETFLERQDKQWKSVLEYYVKQ